LSKEILLDNCEFQPLGQQDRAAFSCGVEDLDDYLKHKISQDQKRGAATPYILVEKPSGDIVGYYTISNTSFILNDIPENIRKKLAKYNKCSAILIGRLARSIKVKGKGVGEHLLMDALREAHEIGKKSAWGVVCVDAKDENAKKFYEQYDFIYVESDNEPPYQMILPKYKVDKIFK
jgi:predicted GNAT family N-acyltransferase